MSTLTTTQIEQKKKKRIYKKKELVVWDYNPPVHFYERLVPKSQAELDNMARELLAWSELEDSLVFSRWASQRMPPILLADLYKFAARPEGENLAKAIEIAKQRIGARREQGSIEYKLNFAAIKETQPLYDPDYKEWKLQAIKSTADHIEKIVVLPAIPKPEEAT